MATYKCVHAFWSRGLKLLDCRLPRVLQQRNINQTQSLRPTDIRKYVLNSKNGASLREEDKKFLLKKFVVCLAGQGHEGSLDNKENLMTLSKLWPQVLASEESEELNSAVSKRLHELVTNRFLLLLWDVARDDKVHLHPDLAKTLKEELLRRLRNVNNTGRVLGLMCQLILRSHPTQADIQVLLKTLATKSDSLSVSDFSFLTRQVRASKKDPNFRNRGGMKFFPLLNSMAESKLDQVKFLGQLNHLVLNMGYIDETESNFPLRVAESYDKFLKEVSWRRSGLNECVQTLRAQSSLHYYNPEFLDATARHLATNLKSLSETNLQDVVSCYSVLNHRIGGGDNQLLLDCYQRLVKLGGGTKSWQILRVLDGLTMSGLFPWQIIDKVFSLEFITKLAQQKGKFETSAADLWHRLMVVSRAIRLECPEITVPWLHDEYCQYTTAKSLDQHRERSLNSDLRRVTSELLGGNQFIAGDALTPYYYLVGPEFILDKDGQPLPYGEYVHDLNLMLNSSGSIEEIAKMVQSGSLCKPLPDGARRVVIGYISRGQVAINCRHHLLGGSQRKQRHLTEALGYSYIQVFHHEWLEMQSQEERKEYLSKKIYSSSSSCSQHLQT